MQHHRQLLGTLSVSSSITFHRVFFSSGNRTCGLPVLGRGSNGATPARAFFIVLFFLALFCLSIIGDFYSAFLVWMGNYNIIWYLNKTVVFKFFLDFICTSHVLLLDRYLLLLIYRCENWDWDVRWLAETRRLGSTQHWAKIQTSLLPGYTAFAIPSSLFPYFIFNLHFPPKMMSSSKLWAGAEKSPYWIFFSTMKQQIIGRISMQCIFSEKKSLLIFLNLFFG